MQIPLLQGNEDDPLIDKFHPILYKNNADTNIMYVDKVFRETNRDQLIEAIQK